MSAHTKTEQHKEENRSTETDLRRNRRRDVAILVIVIILSAVLGYLFISNLNGILGML